jgi:hypothetical protein
VLDPTNLIVRFEVPSYRPSQLAPGRRVEIVLEAGRSSARATVTSISAEASSSFPSVAEAELDETNLPGDFVIASVVKVRLGDGANQKPAIE